MNLQQRCTGNRTNGIHPLGMIEAESAPLPSRYEQNANLALEISHYGYVLETGRIILEAPSKELRANPEVKKAPCVQK